MVVQPHFPHGPNLRVALHARLNFRTQRLGIVLGIVRMHPKAAKDFRMRLSETVYKINGFRVHRNRHYSSHSGILSLLHCCFWGEGEPI